MASIAHIRRAIFARHSNPWSAWSRGASTPLVLLPVWTRKWSHAAAVGLWFAVNPVVFPEPVDKSNWATRAMLGEELWITRRPKDGVAVVSAATSAATVVAIVAARRRRLVAAAAATAVAMALTMVYWQQMVRYFDRGR